MIINIIGSIIVVLFALCMGGLFIILPLGILALFVLSVFGNIAGAFTKSRRSK